MIIQTPAIVISSLKYGDTSKIVKCYTKSSGVKSFIAKDIYSKKNKKNQLFSPLNQIELIYDERSSKSLGHIRGGDQSVYYQTIYQHSQKTAVALFLSEILNSVLYEEESDPDLFEFLGSSFEIFDKKTSAYADFHLWFLMNLTKHLGFYPNLKSQSLFFDLTNGVSSDIQLFESYISGNDLNYFEKLSSLDFLMQTENQFNQNQRKSLLNTLLKYYELHISDFRQPKSLNVLTVIFE